MTVMSTAGTEFTINELVRLAYVMAGLLEETQTLAQAGGGALGRQLLGLTVKGLQAKGITARASSFHEVTLTAGTYEYTMPAAVLDVYGDAMYIDASEDDVTQASGETTVTQISQDGWHQQSAKDATGRPINYFCYRVSTPPKVRLWPIPDEAGTIRFIVHRHLADNSSGSATLDLEDYWCDFIVSDLAARLAEAKTMPRDKISSLKSDAREKLRDARSMSSSRTGSQMVVSHGYWRR